MQQMIDRFRDHNSQDHDGRGKQMTDIFLKSVNMGIAAGWLVLAVMILRLLLRRAPRQLMFALWGSLHCGW